MLAQSSCAPKLLKEYAGSPRTFYEKDTTELELDIDSVKQYSRVLSFFGVKNNEKYCIFFFLHRKIAFYILNASPIVPISINIRPITSFTFIF